MMTGGAWSTHSLGHDALHGSGEGGGHAEAAVVEDVHGHLEAAAHLPQDTVGRHAHVLKVDLCRVGRFDAHLLLWWTAEEQRGTEL